LNARRIREPRGRGAPRRGLSRVLRALGPGVTTGAADDDPSGIATYSVVGAQNGLAFLWTALFAWPLMSCVQLMCARIGMVTGMGLAGAMLQNFPRWLVGNGCAGAADCQHHHIAADLSGMADSAHMLGAGPSMLYVWVFGLGISVLTVFPALQPDCQHAQMAGTGIVCLCDNGILVHPDWTACCTQR